MRRHPQNTPTLSTNQPHIFISPSVSVIPYTAHHEAEQAETSYLRHFVASTYVKSNQVLNSALMEEALSERGHIQHQLLHDLDLP